MVLVSSCVGQSEKTAEYQDGFANEHKNITCEKVSTYSMDDILFNKPYSFVNDKIGLIARVHVNDTLHGNSYPVFVHDNIIYFDKIARLNLANDTSFILKDTLFQLNRNTSIQIFFKDKMYLLNNNGCKVHVSRSYRTFYPQKPRIINGEAFVSFAKKNELQVISIPSNIILWQYASNAPLGNYFQTEKYLYVSTEEKLVKFELLTGKILFELPMPYIVKDFECSNGILFFSVKRLGLFALNIENDIIEWEFKSNLDGGICIDNNVLYYNCGTLFAIDIHRGEVKWAMKTVAFNGESLMTDIVVVCQKQLLIYGFTGSDESGSIIPLLINKESGLITNANWDSNFLNKEVLFTNSKAEISDQYFSFTPKSNNDIIVGLKDNCWLYAFKIHD